MKNIRTLIFITAVSLFIGMLLSGCSRMPTPDFQHLVVPKTPSYALACPDKLCNIPPNIITPVYPVSAEDLYTLFNQMMADKTNVNYIYEIPEQGQFGLAAYFPVLRLPDDIAVQFIALSDNTSTLAILSESRYLFYDFGLNKNRLQEWLAELSVRVNNFKKRAS